MGGVREDLWKWDEWVALGRTQRREDEWVVE